MHSSTFDKIDTYPYRHRLSDIMTAPVVVIESNSSLAVAARCMVDGKIGALVVVDAHGRATGIVTERDVLRAVALHGAEAAAITVGMAMSSPVATMPADAFLFRAIARMDRLGLRHLPLLDRDGRPAGMVSTRALTHQRATAALIVGDEIDVAANTAELHKAHDRLPGVARALLSEQVPAEQVSAVLAAMTRDIVARCADMLIADLADQGTAAPSPWCLLVLGSAGRDETLLAPDQDNALIYAGDPATCDAWFADFAGRLNEMIAAAGIPLCKGNVMARNPFYRRSLDGWKTCVADWIAMTDPESLLAIDIFFDFVPVGGDAQLAASLRKAVTDLAQSAPTFLRLLAARGETGSRPFDLLGRLRTNNGRLDLKLTGTFPIVAAARVIALSCGAEGTSSRARLDAAVQAGVLKADDAERLNAARLTFVELLLRGQLADLQEGRGAASNIDIRALTRREREALKKALQEAQGVGLLVQDALTARRLV